ncbi:MAG: flagellar biosynthesis protein FlhA [Candidatus Eisenbacteria bacterium]
MSAPLGGTTSSTAVRSATTSPVTTTPRSHAAGHGHAVPAGARRSWSPTAETYLAIGVVVIVALLVMPLPPFLLDAFLALSFGLSIVILLVTLSCRDPLEFSIFPSLLLLVTLLRLGLNVCSTRLILGTAEAGQVIKAFGDFVIGGNLVVGLVIFLILVVINFTVITKGAGRVAEVAARFTLDAMPGRQMSIDADLGAGLIDETEAKRRREEISRYADFYGAMDGAAKFVRGDAVAGIVITGINLVGGFAIGMAQHGLSAGESLTTYSVLTVGDGLVTQIPALIVSTAAGVLVTYGTGGVSMGSSIGNQLTRSPRALWTAAALLGCFALIPGLPSVPFLFLGACVGGVAHFTSKKSAAIAAATEADADAVAAGVATPGMPAVQELLAVEPLELEVGYALVSLADEAHGGDLLQRVAILRKSLALELGVVVPPARIRDNIRLGANEYAVKLRGVRVAGGELIPNMLLALDATGSLANIDGVATTDPSFGMPAVWVPSDRRVEAEAAGYRVVDPATVLATHLLETIRTHAAEILTRQAVRELLDGLKETHPALVEDVIPNKISVGTVHRVLQRLLKEGIPIRDLVTILESLSDAAAQTQDPELLAEHARRGLASVIANLLGAWEEPVRAVTVGPRLELALMSLLSPRAREGQNPLDPEQLTGALQSLRRLMERHKRDGAIPPLVTPPSLRLGIRRLVEPMLPRLSVVSLAELPAQTPLVTLDTWELAHAA